MSKMRKIVLLAVVLRGKLRRGLQQMPASSGMEWLIKRIASTTSNEGLLAGL